MLSSIKMLKVSHFASKMCRFTGQIIREKCSSVGAINTFEKPKSKQYSFEYPPELRREHEEFMLLFPDVVNHLTEYAANNFKLMDAAKHFANALEYDVPNGRKNRGLNAVIVYKDLIGKERQTSENIRQAQILGWCIELMVSSYFMADDIIDCSKIRHNKPCWHTLNNVKSIAVNDVLMIENGCYLLLKEFFGHFSCYPRMFELFQESTMNAYIGQSLDFQIGNGDIAQFSNEKYICITNYKTAALLLYVPIALPMIFAGYENEQMFEDIKNISNDAGHFYQVQNDYFDCFNDANVLRKPGTDIEDGRCTWLAVTAMEHVSDEQKDILIKCYGQNDAECIRQVKQVYKDLDLPKLYNQFADQTHYNIKKKIEAFSQQYDLPPNIFLKTLNTLFADQMIYKSD
ncbi:farnesyl pyrophosphate synthase-like [Contarinia nasturtii]|uniref:farnesyl pyrophosphate synthase-like n=1 Tax=Contarinia nasturtii TaxID=265458 RepID=UPI0012D3C6A9|nr:farnesyl pyrophosphate synthase-like [Contarinia nasturtii]